ncbi:MAG TPA: hypothetical protein VKY74_04040 [Chloroflexia bacterium]|nr:hypothetical protein [Chloroflexia bacterium]
MHLSLRHLRLGVGLALVLSAAGSMAPAAAQTAFADPAFQRNWERTDQPVAAGQANRSWYWGPTPGFSIMEPDKDAPGGARLVQYFDKARMEINDPTKDKNDPFYVTNGLLATELMTGRLQVGNNAFEQRCVAEIPLASDTDDATAPTYATFGKLLAQPKSNMVGQPATAVTDRAANVSADSQRASDPNGTLAYYEPITGRNIPKIFWDFLNASGPIYRDGQYTTGPLNQPWFSASGLPVTEAYWANVKIGGKPLDVLIQAYERRVLTYIPAYNGTPFNVQMGNVGQHYYGWRYKGAGCAGAPPPSTPIAGGPPATPAPPVCTDVPPSKDATVTPVCGPVGTVFSIHITGFTPGERLSFWLTAPNGQVAGTPRPLDAGHHPGQLDDRFDSSILPLFTPNPEGIWAITYQGEQSSHQSVVLFKITPAVAPTPTTVGATPAPAPACDTSADRDASVVPSSGPKGTRFAVTITGFRAGEQASYWLTDPDGAVFGSPQVLTIPAGGTGTLYLNTGSLYPGPWALTIHGLRSNHESIAVFCITP